MHRRPGHAWQVESLAQAVQMSRSSFAARFPALVGVPPLTYLTGWRMRLAAQALRRDRQLSIAQVGEAHGYDSEAAFSKAFKRQLGVSPGRWRSAEG